VTLTGADGWALEQTVFLEASDCRSAPVSSAVADPTCWIDLRTLGTTPAEVPTDPEVPEVPETPEAPEVPETPESPAPAAAEQPAAPAEVASAAAEAPRTALPRTGAGGALALVGAGLVAAGRGILRARRRLAGS
jgi:hypothetical protein